jgi:hypothetical protein
VSDKVLRRILYPLTAAVILAYFLFFTWKSLHMYFDTDDMYALYFAWSKPLGQLVRENLFFWKGEFRPLGAFFYRGIFAAAGFNPLPFRIAELGFCVVNLAVCFWFTRLISGSGRTAALATLLFAFQVRMIEVWFRTTIIFDVLCFTFVYLAAGVYIGARLNGGDLSGGRIAAILLTFYCALNAKEMAVCLPVFLVAWELLFNTSKLTGAEAPDHWRRRMHTLSRVKLTGTAIDRVKGAHQFRGSRAFAVIAAISVMIVIYAFGKLYGPAAMANNPSYQPEYTYARFTSTWNEYMKDLFVLDRLPPGWVSMTILGGLLAVALAARSRILIFAWVIIFFGLLPVSFAPARGGYVMYISYVGWVLYAGAVLVAFEDLISRRAPRYRTVVACAVFVLVGWRWGKINLHTLRVEQRPWLYEPPAAVRAMSDQLLAMHPSFPPHTRVLFLEDGFTTGEWTPLFIVRLLYRDPKMIVDRVKEKTDRPPGWDQHTSPDRVHYDFVFTYEGGRYRQVQPAIAGGIPAQRDSPYAAARIR